jgi:hypothetical protein
MARKARNVALRRAMQLDLLSFAEAHPHRRRSTEGEGDHPVQHEYEFSTLLLALGNAGSVAADDAQLQQRTESFLGEGLLHPVLSVRTAAVYSLRHHRTESARLLVRDAALRFDAPERFRRSAISAFVFQNGDAMTRSAGQRGSFLAVLEEMFRGGSSAFEEDVPMDWHANGDWANDTGHSGHRNGRVARSPPHSLHKRLPQKRGAIGSALSVLDQLKINITLGMSDPFDYEKLVGSDDLGLSFSAMADNYLSLLLNPLQVTQFSSSRLSLFALTQIRSTKVCDPRGGSEPRTRHDSRVWLRQHRVQGGRLFCWCSCCYSRLCVIRSRRSSPLRQSWAST